MTIPTFNDGAAYSTVRDIINQNSTANNNQAVKSNEYTTSAELDSGTVTSQTANTITDAGQSWVANVYAGKVVRMLTANGEEDYGIIQSNTADTLTLDDNHANLTFTTYSIIYTVELPEVNSITAFNVTDYGAIVLPLVASLPDVSPVQVFLETSDGTKGLIVMCSGTDRQRGLKWGKLIYRYESVELLSDISNDHWDINALEGIKRYGSFATNTDLAITSAVYQEVLTTGTIDLGQARRFSILTDGGTDWLKYDSIISQDFRLSGAIPIQRSGGGTSLVELKIRVKRFATGLDEDSVIKTLAEFNGDDTKTIPIDIPFSLQPYDQITLIAQRDAGTINILTGASLIFSEM